MQRTALLGFVILGSLLPLRAQTFEVWNESRTLRFSLALDEGRLTYQVAAVSGAQATTVVESSPLGLVRQDATFTDGLRFVRAEPPRAVTGEYRLVAGKRHDVRYRGLEQTFRFTNATGQLMTITVHAEADGVAFRYGFPAGPEGELAVTGEATGFKLPEDGRGWMQPYDQVAVWSPAYEAEYRDAIAVGTAAPSDSAGWALPLLFHVRRHWVLITEAAMDGTSFAVHAQPDAEHGLYRVRLPEPGETYGAAPQAARITAPWQSPWRVIVVGATPAAPVETLLVYNLSAPSEVAETGWIHPGRSSWSWWSDKGSPADYHRLVPFVDLSADFGWEYSLLDLGWERMANGSIEQLIAYAKQRHVGLTLWYNSGGRHNRVDAGLRDLMADPAKREEEFAKLERWGVKGVKVDFMQSDKQDVIQLYLDLLRAAARHHLVVDFHGATIPRGWARTFPNLLTSEGVRGAEQYWDPQFAAKAHTLHTIYCFTRNALGSMDYTPVIFGAAPELQWHRTTNAHELALAVAFESGLQHYVDSVAAYRAQPDVVQQLLKEIPADWDETRYVAGEPGRLAVLARRRGATWYVAALNGLDDPQVVTVPLDFLTQEAEATVVTDGTWQKEVKTEQRRATRADRLTWALAGRGGALARFAPAGR
jgi:hypothetical protein